MTDKEKELSEKYLAFKDAEQEARTKALEVQKELSQLSPHKVGEIVKWTEVNRKRVGGTFWKPVYQDLPPVERKAVLTFVKAYVDRWNDGTIALSHRYEFKPIKKDGGISQQHTHPNYGYEWTGEIHRDFIDKDS